MVRTKPDQDFDWVQARTECSPSAIFERLKISLKTDAKIRTQALIQKGSDYGFSVISEGRSVSVFVQGNNLSRSVVFDLTEDGVSVHTGDKHIAEATLTLNDEGECRLKVGDKELELWQFRKFALEEFFFVDHRRV